MAAAAGGTTTSNWPCSWSTKNSPASYSVVQPSVYPTQVLEEWLPRLWRDHDPQLAIFQAGVDALAADSFGRCRSCRRINNVLAVLTNMFNGDPPHSVRLLQSLQSGAEPA